jgi:hypothetical protein
LGKEAATLSDSEYTNYQSVSVSAIVGNGYVYKGMITKEGYEYFNLDPLVPAEVLFAIPVPVGTDTSSEALSFVLSTGGQNYTLQIR